MQISLKIHPQLNRSGQGEGELSATLGQRRSHLAGRPQDSLSLGREGCGKGIVMTDKPKAYLFIFGSPTH